MEFPYKRNDVSDLNIKKMFKKLENENPSKRIKYDKPFFFRQINFDINTFLFRYTYIDHPSSNYENFDTLSDMFQEYNRIRCKRLSAEYSVYDYFINNQEKIKEYTLQKYKKIDNYNLREAIHNLYGKKYECSSFRPMNLRTIIDMFNVKSILDFSSGWGDRLIGAMASDVEYVGIDANPELFKGYEEMINFFGKSPEKYLMINSPAEKATIPKRDYDLVFTSPPYFALEKYTNHKNQSLEQYNSMNKWLEKFLFVSIKKCYDLLIDNGHLVININQYNRNEDYVVRMIDYINNLVDSHFLGVIGYRIEKNPQPIWIWKKSKELPQELYESNVTIVKTERINIRVFRLDDLKQLEVLFSKKENMKNIYNGKVLSKKETKDKLINNYIKQQYSMYAIEHKKKIIGIVGYYNGKYLDNRLRNKILLRIMIDEDYRGKGFGKESLNSILKYLINVLGYKKIYSLIEIDNSPSIQLHKKLKFKEVSKMNIRGKDYILLFIN